MSALFVERMRDGCGITFFKLLLTAEFLPLF